MGSVSEGEPIPYSERSILVLGGSGVNSIGRAAVDDFHRIGVKAVYVGTTNLENYGKVIAQYERRGLPTDKLYPFVANVTDESALARAAQDIKATGLGLTDVIFSHAGGMEGFMNQLIGQYLTPIREITRGKSMYTLPDNQQEAIRAIMDPMRKQIEIWREEAIPHGIAVNHGGTFNAIGILAETFPDGFRGIFINSTWGHLSGTEGVEIPRLYGPVEESKAMVRDTLRDEGGMLQAAGTPIAQLIASLVRRTRVGKTFQDYLMPISSPEQAAAIADTAVNPEDVVVGMRMIMESDTINWDKPSLELFVTGRKGAPVFSSHLELSSMYTEPYPY